MFKNSLEYKICELSTKIKLMNEERINFRKEYLQSIHTEDLSHLRNHFQTHVKNQGFGGRPNNAKLKSSSDDDAADAECGFIEL